MLAYMLTWTTYGTWLQGDVRGYVKDGRVCGANAKLYAANVRSLRQKPVRFDRDAREIVRGRVLKQADRMGQEVLAIAVYSNHVHVVVRTIDRPVPRVVQMYKRAATNRLRDFGFEGKVWTRKYDVRNCYDEVSLKQMVEYVLRHED